MIVDVNSIHYEGSVVDGPGVRTVVYLQGCDKHCDGCHNFSTWKKNCGIKYEIADLANEIALQSPNKKITISGGEPFFQANATCELIKALFERDFDVCVYTGNDFEEIERDFGFILPYVHYLKVGKYIKELRTTTTPFVGSTNQRFLTLKDGRIDE